MKYRYLPLVIALVSSLFVGCFGGDGDTTVKTMDEYRQDAAASVTETNADAQLEQLAKEIDNDVD